MRLQSCRKTLNLDADGRGCFFTPCQVAGLNVPVHQTLNFFGSSVGRLWDLFMGREGDEEGEKHLGNY